MKTCAACGESKPEEEFYFQVKTTGKRHSKCKACKSAAAKARWASGSETQSNYASKARRVARAHDYIWNLFKESKCFDCGERNPIVFEFDHLDPETKFADIAKMISSNYGLEAIKREIAKCDIVCANCHKIRTSTRGNHWRYARSTAE